MKNSLPILIILGTLLSSAPCFALVRELALCTTSDGAYTVSVTENQGTGRTRTAHITASVTDSNDKVVAAYKVEESHGVHSASFGRHKYLDTDTSGTDFLLAGPSTNFHYYSLSLQMNVGQNIARIVNYDLKCSVFGGHIVQRRVKSN